MTRIRFEDLPSTNTPRNAENLNKLNNVVISATTPTTGEEVWMQKGKNLFNALGVSYGSPYNVSYVINNKNQLSITNNGDWAQLPVNINGLQPNSTYTITTKTTNNSNCPAGLFIDNSNYKVPTQSETVSVTTQTDGNGTLYFVLYSNWSGTPSTGTILYDEIQVEGGSASTSFENYIDRKIYTKNDNGVYEEFYNEENLEVYSTSEQRIGTWIDGKPLYRRAGEISVTSNTPILNNVSTYNFKKVTGWIVRDEGFENQVGVYTGETDFATIYRPENKDSLIISTSYSGTLTYIIEYTKITD